LAKVAVQCSADTFVVNQSWFSASTFVVKIATFAKRQTVEQTVADAILDRLVHQSIRVELKGESLRKLRKENNLIETEKTI
jgi:DNA replication protein DnaC